MLRKVALFAAVVIVLGLQACGSSGGGSAAFLPTGSVSVSLTDGPGDFDHVFITVKDIWFHADAGAGPAGAGWHKFPLASPLTVDLLSLSNGVVGSPVWDKISLPMGAYQQIRIILAPTDPSVLDPLTAAATGFGMTLNNEVVAGGTHYALRIPDALHGIMLTGSFQVNPGGHLKLAIDFDAGHDIVDIQRSGMTEYILKPRLAYFDLDDAGAIVGSMDVASAMTNSTSRFVIKAEQVNDPQNPQYHVVRRWTVVNPADGRFVLYPLKPGIYDILIRGVNHKTVIIKNVPVSTGTTPLTATVIPQVTMSPGTDYFVDGSITFPTGAWTDFYQTVAGDAPYEVRFRHFNPVLGRFLQFPLSNDDILVGAFNSTSITLSPTTPVEGTGGFHAVAGAVLFSSASFTANGSDIVSSATTTVAFGSLTPKTPPSIPGGRTLGGAIAKPSTTMGGTLNRGIVFVAQGGMIVHAASIDTQMQMMSGATYSISGLPGGSPASPLPLAFYGVDAIAWDSGGGPAKAIAMPDVADLRTADDMNVDMNMIMLP